MPSVAATINPILRWDTINPSASARSRPMLRKMRAVTPASRKKIAKASAVIPIICTGLASRPPITLPMTAATKTNRTRILTPSIGSLWRWIAATRASQRIIAATSSDPVRIAASFSPRANGDRVSVVPKKIEANKGAVNGTGAVLVTNVTSTSVASSPMRAASEGAAIIGEATACNIGARNRSGERASSPPKWNIVPTIASTASVVQAVAASSSAGRSKYAAAREHRRA
jgi:hypothetical protein